LFTDNDLHAVRLISTPPVVFTDPIRKSTELADWSAISRYLKDDRVSDVVQRFGSLHNESWEIIGEFPLTHTATTDAQGNPDTSWYAKIPSDTPTLIQGLDQNGMTLFSELTWRALKAGEDRTDCGGCHAHSIPALDWDLTQAGQNAPILNVPGVNNSDPRIQSGYWDLTQGTIPVLNEAGVEFYAGRSLAVEFNRDVLPVINARCTGCHTAGQANGGLELDLPYPDDAWAKLTDKAIQGGGTYTMPQRSKYIRVPQARQSLLAWVAYDQRLDGRSNSSRADDVDYPAHPILSLPDAEKRAIARWIDLGGPVDFPATHGFGYTEDNQLPVISIHSPKRGVSIIGQKIRFGVADAISGVNWDSLAVSYYPAANPGAEATLSLSNAIRDDGGVTLLDMPALTNGVEYVLVVTVADNAGNTETSHARFTVQAGSTPAAATGVILQ
jgi:hypothetical protein